MHESAEQQARAADELEVRREIEVDATPEEVWEAVATEEGRERWLDHDEAEREIQIESTDAPHRLVWWWSAPDAPVTRVAFDILATPTGTRVVVTESAPAPTFPLARMQASLMLVAA
jgi:uncharacterized protein YndB with AHSA1/START domain